MRDLPYKSFAKELIQIFINHKVERRNIGSSPKFISVKPEEDFHETVLDNSLRRSLHLINLTTLGESGVL